MLGGALIECSIRVKPTGGPFSTAAPSVFATAGPGRSPFGTSTTTSAFGVPAPSPPSTTSAFNPVGLARPGPGPGAGTFGKPVIYLFAREEMDVSVSVSLIPQWSFSVLYPRVPIENTKSSIGRSRLHERVQWDVETKNDGMLREKNSGLDVAYLFWEANVNRDKTWDVPPSPTSEPDHDEPERPHCTSDDTDCFDPLSCTVDPGNSVILSVETITPYSVAARQRRLDALPCLASGTYYIR
ncbi:hypothetical protein PM082_006321 [Marasmius tenuissimus]|nr:hypothetical protein PM082_006321 [Marasmius tenuissimus]